MLPAGHALINAGIAVGMGLGPGHWDVGRRSGAFGLVAGELVLRTMPLPLVPVATPKRSGVVLSTAV